MANPFNLFKKKTEDNTDLIKQLNIFYDEAVTATESRREKWKMHYNYWINKQLSSSRPTYRSDIRVNYCWTVTQVKIPVMTQNRPTVTFISYDEQDEEKASKLSQLIGNALWNKLEVQNTLVDVILNSQIYDAGFWKIGFDPSAKKGIGEIFVNSIEPFKILPDPSAKKLEDCRYVIHIEPYPVSTLKAKYPEYADKFSADPKISDILFEGRKYEDRIPSASRTYTDSTKFVNERAFVKEFWIAASECPQDEMIVVEERQEEVPGTDENGLPTMITQTVQVKEPKYKNGRVITMVGDCIVADKPNPFIDGEFPFVKQVSNKVADDFWGIGDLEQIIPLQDALNHIYQQEDDIISKTANMGWTIDPSVGKENVRKIAQDIDKPGAVKVVEPGKLRPDIAPQIPNALVQMKQDIKYQIETVSGITDILTGNGRVQHRTARGLEILNESATSRIGLSIRLMEDALKQVAFKMASRAQQFYTEDRKYAITGSTGTATDIISVTPEDLEGEYEVSIDTGIALPKDKKSRADLAFNLLQNHVFEMALSGEPMKQQMAKTMLDAVEWPGREQILSFKAPEPVAPPPANIPPGAAPAGPAPQGNPLAALMAAAGAGPTNGVQ